MDSLLQAARKGKQDAFASLYDEHHLPLFRFAWRLTGSTADILGIGGGTGQAPGEAKQGKVMFVVQAGECVLFPLACGLEQRIHRLNSITTCGEKESLRNRKCRSILGEVLHMVED